MTIAKLPEWAAWLAQDADGTWWAYEAEPNQQDRGWYERLKSGASSGWGKPRRPSTGKRR